MEDQSKRAERTWNDVHEEMAKDAPAAEAAATPQETLPEREHTLEAMDSPVPQDADSGAATTVSTSQDDPASSPQKPRAYGVPRQPVGKKRVTLYLLLAVLLNFLLAIYSLYILSLSMSTVTAILSAGETPSMLRMIVIVFVMITPLLFAILGNRLLFLLMRGKGRFPRSLPFFAFLLVVAVQALTIYVLFVAGAAPMLEAFDISALSSVGY